MPVSQLKKWKAQDLLLSTELDWVHTCLAKQLQSLASYSKLSKTYQSIIQFTIARIATLYSLGLQILQNRIMAGFVFVLLLPEHVKEAKAQTMCIFYDCQANCVFTCWQFYIKD